MSRVCLLVASKQEATKQKMKQAAQSTHQTRNTMSGGCITLDAFVEQGQALARDDPAYTWRTVKEHPLLQHPCWQVHPCKTKDVLAQVCASPPNATADDDDDDDDGADADVLAGDDPGEDDAEATLAADHSTQQREQPSRQHSYLEAFISTIGRLVGMPQPQPQRHRPPA
ncbi:hypothetical protein PTSG_04174 [Salpingoeca rosetta]|uniref:Uncharacterized protein n=1 Tax=Salpingoeca rosetta (strain ATCC 50818 / BSB-021) TaxID=946362 RepID=F2U6T6_SALR5|nr:uncharacterized protein PTSG_04174 [Salpingoeca rosetta]EGD83568.1 hypothetical protein PTSG_04174 [Salpingoeca rosetta]|eukprot:XP_004995072.1 hypothetical protein PTSG_04174 [Salpingoeca rosetta]